MNMNKTVIALILDRSGSMESVRGDVIGGVNRFLNEQQRLPGECLVTIVQFDSQDPYDVVTPLGPVADARRLSEGNYIPRAGTPLYDAIGRGIIDLGAKLAAMAEHDRPGKVVFVVQTDGYENSSREYTAKTVRDMIATQQSMYSWQFVFLGQSIDAYAVGAGIGVGAAGTTSMGPGGQNVNKVYDNLHSNVARYRCGATRAATFTTAEQEDVK